MKRVKQLLRRVRRLYPLTAGAPAAPAQRRKGPKGRPKQRKEAVIDPGFRPATGLHYTKLLNGLHEKLAFDWYLEVGCRTGRSFAPVRGKTIAVDPYFSVQADVIGTKPQLHVFQQTSDDFFESGFLNACGIQLSVSFLDGMHLFEFLLRDFMNAEAASRNGGVIAMHDCCPYNRDMAEREHGKSSSGGWTGDVWKLIPILQRHRPDLTVTVLDCKPTGLVLVSGLDPENRVLRERYHEILAEWTSVTIEDYGPSRFYGEFDYTDAQAFADGGYPLFRGAALAEGPSKPVWVSP